MVLLFKLYKKYLNYILGILTVGTVLLVIVFYSSTQSDGRLHVSFFDVGQGDSIFIKTPKKQKILIDGGPDKKVLSELGKSLPFYDRTIDIVFLTHPHADHLTGLIEVLKRYKVKLLVLTGITYTTPEYLEFLDFVNRKNISTKLALAGQNFDFGEGVEIEIIYPTGPLVEKEVEDLNETSIITKLVFDEVSFLFTGDVEKEIQTELKGDLDIDILKMPHHGSESSISVDFLKETTPEVAVISVGKNKFGHPDGSTLEMLKSSEIKIWRTDEAGTIKIVSDGKKFWRK